jgi:hypothetical protein
MTSDDFVLRFYKALDGPRETLPYTAHSVLIWNGNLVSDIPLFLNQLDKTTHCIYSYDCQSCGLDLLLNVTGTVTLGDIDRHFCQTFVLSNDFSIKTDTFRFVL